MNDTLFTHIDSLIRDAGRIEKDIDLFVSGGKIAALGRNLEGREDVSIPETAERIDCRGKILFPGFINAHTHLYQCFLRGKTDSVALKSWNEEVIFPFADRVHTLHWEANDIEAGYYWSLVGCIEMIRSGVTGFVNMDLTLDSSYRAYIDSGMRAAGAVTAVNRWIPKKLDRDLETRKKEIIGYIEKWHRHPESAGKVQVFIAPSTPFACTEEFLHWQMDQAEKYDLGVQIHVSENRWEIEQARKEYGTTPLAYLEQIGFLRRPILAVHCVHLTDEELAIALEKGVIPIYNPKSNMKLGSGVAPIPKMLKMGLKPALATDGAASNDLLNIFEEMRCGAGLQKAAHLDASIFTAEDIFTMATENGARAMGIDGGTIDPGREADFVILSGDRIWSAPVHDPIQNLVYCCTPGNVESVYIGGDPVLKDGEFTQLDEAAVFQKAKDIFREKFGNLGSDFSAEF